MVSLPYRAHVEIYLAGLDGILPPDAVGGVYLTGSAALGDYQHGHSNLDLLVLTTRALEAAESAALARLHAQLENGAQPHIDATYLQAEILAGLKLLNVREQAYAVKGAFRPGASPYQPMTWATLAQRGVNVRGPAAKFLGAAPDQPALVAWCHRVLEESWRPLALQVRQVTVPRDRAAPTHTDQLVWLATGPGRLYWTIATGEVVSKARSADLTAEVFSDYAELLARVKASRLGDESITFTNGDVHAVSGLIEEVCDITALML